MKMTLVQQMLTIAICSLGTMATRFLPFLILSSKKPVPKYMQYLGRALPGAVFGMLVVYCLKNVSVLAFPFGLPELIAVLAVVLLHLWKRKMLLSVAGATVLYMVLVQFVFK